jgi:serine O-acetyltransferase
LIVPKLLLWNVINLLRGNSLFIIHLTTMLIKDFDNIVERLTESVEYPFLNHRSTRDNAMPSIETLNDILVHLRKIIFPGYFGHEEIHPGSTSYYVGANLDMVIRMLSEQIRRGFCFYCENDTKECRDCDFRAVSITNEFINRLPEIKELLAKDVIAAFNGDPAAKDFSEVIFCYPCITALTHHRIAHELYRMEVPLIPRIISELSHSITGIDIHPGAKIGEYCFIDHGTGVVIGETTIIGNNVRIYQGVTLGAKSFPLDENGTPIKGVDRHPIVEDDVIIYANATILGRVTIKKGAIVGGNSWITQDVEGRDK